MKIVWSRQAVDDLAEVYDYIARDDPEAANAVVARIISLIKTRLPATPHMGRPGRVAGTRELVVPGTPFVLPYRVRGRHIEIIRVYHGTRRWPSDY
jgi:toxin ParE1/3/4